MNTLLGRLVALALGGLGIIAWVSSGTFFEEHSEVVPVVLAESQGASPSMPQAELPSRIAQVTTVSELGEPIADGVRLALVAELDGGSVLGAKVIVKQSDGVELKYESTANVVLRAGQHCEAWAVFEDHWRSTPLEIRCLELEEEHQGASPYVRFVRPGADVEVALVLGPRASIHGIVNDVDGLPVSSATVTATSLENVILEEVNGVLRRREVKAAPTTTTDAMGQFSLKELHAGSQVRGFVASGVVKKGFQTETLKVGENLLRITLPRLHRIRGQVIADRALVDGRVYVVEASATPRWRSFEGGKQPIQFAGSSEIGNEGFFVVDVGTDNASCVLVIASSSHAPEVVAVDLSQQENSLEPILVSEWVECVGTILDEAGNGAMGASVSARFANGRLSFLDSYAESSEGGSFSLLLHPSVGDLRVSYGDSYAFRKLDGLFPGGKVQVILNLTSK